MPRTTSQWDKQLPFGEHCVAPEAWRASMLSGQPDPLFRVVRAVSLDELNVKNADVVKLLQLEDLTHLRTLDLGRDNKYATNMWKALLSAPATRQLENLRITSFRSEHIKALGTPHHLARLRHVRLFYSSLQKYDMDAVEELFATPSLAYEVFYGTQTQTYQRECAALHPL